MRRWTTILTAMMFVLLLWTGGVAHASEPLDCTAVTTCTAGDIEGDDGALPSDSGKCVAHHHSECSSHQLATRADGSDVIVGAAVRVVPVAWREAGVPARGPDSLLRPPIA